MRRCPNCDYDLSNLIALTNIPTLSERNTLETQAQAQAVEPGTPDDSAANEYDGGETDCLILRNGEDKSYAENVAGAMPKIPDYSLAARLETN
jgi:hypothetical protein